MQNKPAFFSKLTLTAVICSFVFTAGALAIGSPTAQDPAALAAANATAAAKPAAAPALLELPSGTTQPLPAAPAVPTALPVLPPVEKTATPPIPALPATAVKAPLAVMPIATAQGGVLSQSGMINLPDKPVTATPAATDSKVYAPKLYTIDQQSKLQVLEEPVHIPADFSLMFSEKEMVSVVEPSLLLFDKSGRNLAALSGKAESGDDLTDLLDHLKNNGTSTPVKQPQLPNMYLGSILYYSADNWSVWINGKKIVNRINSPANVLYVSRIDRTSVDLVWKPALFKELLKLWNDRISRPGPRPEHIDVDEAKGQVILQLHTNQTFVPRAMAIIEGLIIQPEAANPAPAAEANPATASGASAIKR